MENASKALIIAGAILLSILIIGLGMYIYTQAAGAMDGANLDPQKAEAYNREFLNYAGTNVSGTRARSLYTAIAAHNRANSGDATLQIALTIGGTAFEDNATQAATEEAKQLPSNTLKAGLTYVVSFAYDPNSGFITACNITPKTN